MNTPTELVSPMHWSPKWEADAPLPLVFSNGNQVYLIYLIDPDHESTNLNPTENGHLNYLSNTLALVEFSGSTFRFGIANDEVFQGLPIYHKGLQDHSAGIVENSSWIRELKSVHHIHPYYNEASWNKYKHFILLFKDQILEVIAEDYKIETSTATFPELAAEVARRMTINHS